VKKIVIRVRYGGLGDHLLWSPIPRIAKQTHGYDKVFISNYSDYRNSDTKKLVWEDNSYVDGFVDEDAPAPNFAAVENGKNILDAILDFVRLPDDGLRFREPEIYYTPKIISELSDAVLIDPNSINKSGVPSYALTQKYFQDKCINVTHQMCSIYTELPNNGRIKLRSHNLEHFCDMIISCKEIFCYTTGVATLAAALGKSANVLFIPGIKPMFHHSKLHKYIKL